MRPLVSVVIPARNAATTIAEQLDALEAQDFAGPWEVIVVDNASTDGTAAVVRARQGSMTSLMLERCETRGAGAARNAGARAARADKILVCDADDIVDEGWVRHMAAALDGADIVGGRLECTNVNTEFIAATRENVAETELPTCHGRLYCLGGNAGYRKHAFDALGGFDESLLPGAEDEDFGFRATEAGYAIAFVREAVVHYRFREGLRAYAYQYYRYAQGAAQLYAKHAATGALRVQTLRAKMSIVRNHARALVRLDLLLRKPTRWRYVQELAWAAGAAVGYLRFRQAV
jgi:glycosyltransferase involved in cell wall biosynthesis